MKMLWEKFSMFDMQVVVADHPQEYPRKGDQFIMQVLIKAGYADNMLIQLNWVQIPLQLLFMSNILTASGNKVSTEILFRCPQGEARSNINWPNEHPTDLDFQVWKNAMLSICPSWSNTSKVGKFIHKTHRIWQWSQCKIDSTLHRLHKDGKTEDVFVLGRKPNQFQYLHIQPCSKHHIICSVQPTLEGEHWRLLLNAPRAKPIPALSSFLNELQSWGNTWLWEHLTMAGRIMWLVKPITNEHWLPSLMGHTSESCFQSCFWPRSSLNVARNMEELSGHSWRNCWLQMHIEGNYLDLWPSI
jgi:hypothetical protein